MLRREGGHEIIKIFGRNPRAHVRRQHVERAGSQLVVPSDRCGARYVSAITRVWVGAYATPH